MKILSMTVAVFIASCLGVLAAYGQENANAAKPQQPVSNTPNMMMRLMDLNKDGRISEDEYRKFFIDADQDRDGFITQKELMNLMDRRRQELDGPKLGDMAPDFVLKTLDGKSHIRLSDFRGRDPVVLVFGSYT